MGNAEVYVVGACALIVLAAAVRQLAGAARRKASEWISPVLLLATAALLVLTTVQLRRWASRSALAVMDMSSVQATFQDIAAEGAQQQLVFHYRVRNTAASDFVLDSNACAFVSFRFRPGAKYDPASALLEKDSAAYARYTGLVRLPRRTIELRPCPLVLKPGQAQDLTVSVPYAYPSKFGPADPANLQAYVRSNMRNVDAFGVANSRGTRGILLPKSW